MTTERPFLFAHMLQISKWSLRNLILYTFLMISYMYITPVQGHITPWGQTFDVNRKPLSHCPCVKFKKRNQILYTFLMILCNYIVPGWLRWKGFAPALVCPGGQSSGGGWNNVKMVRVHRYFVLSFWRTEICYVRLLSRIVVTYHIFSRKLD